MDANGRVTVPVHLVATTTATTDNVVIRAKGNRQRNHTEEQVKEQDSRNNSRVRFDKEEERWVHG